jgi:hypothetical protein
LGTGAQWQNCEEQTQLNAVRPARLRAQKRRSGTVAKAKPKRAPVKKAAREERMKQHVTPVVEIVAAEVTEQPAPNVITVTEVEETRKAS